MGRGSSEAYPEMANSRDGLQLKAHRIQREHAPPTRACCLHIPEARRGIRQGRNLSGEPPGKPWA